MAVFHDSQGPHAVHRADRTSSARTSPIRWVSSPKRDTISRRSGSCYPRLPASRTRKAACFPALFGTVTLIILMALCSFPLGVLAGVYLGEYAQDGVLVRLVRIGVNNLAGIPSIVYGIFGVGFFINYLGLANRPHAVRPTTFQGTGLRHGRRPVGRR